MKFFQQYQLLKNNEIYLFVSKFFYKQKDNAFALPFFNVPEEGLEPSHPKICDFESHASTNSATPASMGNIIGKKE